jgi:hypothetical protein
MKAFPLLERDRGPCVRREVAEVIVSADLGEETRRSVGGSLPMHA